MSNVQRLTITETLAQVPAKLGFLPRESLMVIAMSKHSAVRAIYRADLATVTDLDTREHILHAFAKQFDAHQIAGVLLGIYSEGGHAEHAAVTEATRAFLSEHVASVFVHYVTNGIVTDEDGTNARIIDQDPVTASRTINAPTANALAKARKVEGQLWPAEARPKALEQTLTLLKACADDTYPDVTTPALLGAVAALATSIAGRDALVIAVTDDSEDYGLARRLAVDPSTPGVREVLGAFLGTANPNGPEGIKPDTDALRAKAVMLWDVHAHAKTPMSQTGALTVLAMLAFWHNDTAAALTYAHDAITVAEDMPTFARLAQLITAATQAGLTPGWATRIE
ncbi:DUF4192 family protein [Demequina lutea]|uniref:DUF4192 domain-containing protein n=1 Tax=Demequina lutea TaxID=431489 RepID=A0A7Y9ZE61_9MICO|nr:DUF4192 family protein [Demequina lutea]NYI42918.1 hypothetical protein [Demequina lutea]